MLCLIVVTVLVWIQKLGALEKNLKKCAGIECNKIGLNFIFVFWF